MMIERGRNMAQINRDRIAGMNIHYLYYSLPYFLDAQHIWNSSLYNNVLWMYVNFK